MVPGAKSPAVTQPLQEELAVAEMEAAVRADDELIRAGRAHILRRSSRPRRGASALPRATGLMPATRQLRDRLVERAAGDGCVVPAGVIVFPAAHRGPIGFRGVVGARRKAVAANRLVARSPFATLQIPPPMVAWPPPAWLPAPPATVAEELSARLPAPPPTVARIPLTTFGESDAPPPPIVAPYARRSRRSRCGRRPRSGSASLAPGEEPAGR